MERIGRTHIPIPSVDAYLLAAAIVYSLSGFSMAAWAYASWFNNRVEIDFFWIYVGALLVAALLGIAAFGAGTFLRWRPWSLALSVPVGLALGMIATLADRWIVRYWTRRRVLKSTTLRQAPRLTQRIDPTKRVSAIRALASSGSPNKTASASHHVDLRALRWRFTPLVLAGALEEVVFRGTLVFASWLLIHPIAVAAALLASVVAFSLSHIQYGWVHVWAKTPLGLVCLGSVLILDTLAAAVIAHMVFNAKVCWDVRRASTSVKDIHRLPQDSASR